MTKKRATVFLKDRFGEKPLYLLNLNNKYIAFSSDISSFLTLNEFNPVINENAASSFFKRGWIASSYCIWNDIIKNKTGKFS